MVRWSESRWVENDGLYFILHSSEYPLMFFPLYSCWIGKEEQTGWLSCGDCISLRFWEQMKAHNCILTSDTFTGWYEAGSSFLWGPLFDPSSQSADYSVSNSMTKKSPSALFRGIQLLPWNTVAPAGNGKVPVMNCGFSQPFSSLVSCVITIPNHNLDINCT